MRLGPGWRRLRGAAVAVAALALANVAVLLAATLPAWDAATASGASERASMQAQETLEPVLVRARGVYGAVGAAEDDLHGLRRAVGARSGTVSEVVATLRAAVDAAGLEAVRIGYQSRQVPELGLQQLQVDLPVRGDYPQLRRFLEALLEGPIFAVVERVGAATPGSADQGGRLLMNVTLSVFGAPSVPDPVTAPAADSAAAGAGPVDLGDPLALAQLLRERLASLPPIPLPPAAFDVNLEALAAARPEAPASRRNLFAFAAVARPPARERSDAERAARRREATFQPAPVMPYDLLGIIRTAGGLIATLSDGDHVYNLREGEVLPDGMRLAKVGPIGVVLDTGLRRTELSLREGDETTTEEVPAAAAAPAPTKKKKKKKTNEEMTRS